VRLAGCDHHVVDRGRQVAEERLEGSRIRGVEGRSAQRGDLARGDLEPLGIAAGEDQLGPLSACSSGGFEPDAGATADHDDGLPEEFRFALDGRGVVCGAHHTSKLETNRKIRLRSGLLSCFALAQPPCSPRKLERTVPSSEIQGGDQSGCVSVLSSSARPNEGRYRPKFNSKSLRTP